MTARWMMALLGVASFLAAAKTHGRQLRLEREWAGIWTVDFGGGNPPFVEALWRRERFLFWGTLVVLVAASFVVRAVSSRFPRGVDLALAAHLVLPFVTAFVLTGLASVIRFALATRRAGPASADAAWLTAAVWGSAGWWALTLLLYASLAGALWVARQSVLRS